MYDFNDNSDIDLELFIFFVIRIAFSTVERDLKK